MKKKAKQKPGTLVNLLWIIYSLTISAFLICIRFGQLTNINNIVVNSGRSSHSFHSDFRSQHVYFRISHDKYCNVNFLYDFPMSFGIQAYVCCASWYNFSISSDVELFVGVNTNIHTKTKYKKTNLQKFQIKVNVSIELNSMICHEFSAYLCKFKRKSHKTIAHTTLSQFDGTI